MIKFTNVHEAKQSKKQHMGIIMVKIYKVGLQPNSMDLILLISNTQSFFFNTQSFESVVYIFSLGHK